MIARRIASLFDPLKGKSGALLLAGTIALALALQGEARAQDADRPGTGGAKIPRSILLDDPRPMTPPQHRPANVADDGACVPLAEMVASDQDGDFKRNWRELSSPKLCMKQDIFTEGALQWHLQIIRNKENPNAVLWFVPHDNENTAFNTAVYGVIKHGGTVVAVETNGERFNGPQDPNRNFDAGTGRKCRDQVAYSPLYTRHVLRWRAEGMPVIALHTNDRGHAGDGRGGSGGISMARPLSGSIAYRAHVPFQAASPDDTMVFVASLARRSEDANLSEFIEQLSQRGVNVMYEFVSAERNDCSFSNYASLKNIRDYLNIEVVHGDDATQRRVLDTVVELLQSQPIGPLRRPAPETARTMPPLNTGSIPEPRSSAPIRPNGAIQPWPSEAMPARRNGG